MKVSGFTFIRNAIKYDYPVVEAIKSVLPLVDDFYVAVGNSEDDTLGLIAAIDPDKIKIINSIWDDSLREGGRVLALETDKAFAAIPDDTDWAFYIQGDEVIPETSYEPIKKAMLNYLHDSSVDGLLFNYLHFYGSYDYVGDSLSWYPNEIRIIRNNKKIYSYRDAQGFRKNDNEKLRVKSINAWVYHYGWVKEPKAMQKKQEDFNKLWHDDEWVNRNIKSAQEFDYSSKVKKLSRFKGEHPEVMQARIKSKNWHFDMDISYNRLSIKDKIKLALKKYLGLDFSYKNYRLV